MKSNITLQADKVKISGPKVDGGFTLSFEVGEHMQSEIAKCLLIPQQTGITVELTVDNT